MKIVVIGLGSMGKRRIRNLKKLKCKNIVGFDIREDRRKEVEKIYGINTVSTVEEVLEENPHCMIISTPPDLHLKFAKLAIENNIHFFTEVNLFSKDISEILKKIKQKKIIGVPSCTMLYHPIMKKLEKLNITKQIGKPLTVYHHFGHYLPNWHPWEDYRKFYVSKRKTGAAREVIPFELVWLTHFFSDIKSVYGNIKKISKIEADIDDIYQVLIEFKNGIQCTLIVDVISDPAFNETEIVGEKGVIICKHNEGIIKIGKNQKWKSIKINITGKAKGYLGNTPSESLYIEEMNAFLNAVRQKKKYPHSFKEELKMLKILDAIETSNKKSKKIIIKN